MEQVRRYSLLGKYTVQNRMQNQTKEQSWRSRSEDTLGNGKVRSACSLLEAAETILLQLPPQHDCMYQSKEQLVSRSEDTGKVRFLEAAETISLLQWLLLLLQQQQHPQLWLIVRQYLGNPCFT